MIYVLLADGFEDIEALEPVDILRRAEIEVKTVGIAGKSVTSAHDITVSADITIDEVLKEDMTMLVLPGGSGHVNLDASSEVHALISYAAENEIYIAAICASPSIIGKLGLLEGRKYTCFPGFEQFAAGGIFSEEKAVLDGKFLTAKGAGAASDFGFKMVEIFKGKDLSESLKKQMQY
ncbi:MAG: DJ-1/PfpI family protein [Clostridia bacterium]|nr:DJ-1/PfpI family protein [Clostridia bacterium]